MSRKLVIDPVTRIEGHAKVHIDIGDDGKIDAATLHVLEFRGFERFVQGMQAELMPTLPTTWWRPSALTSYSRPHRPGRRCCCAKCSTAAA
jgi:hypothetical protein